MWQKRQSFSVCISSRIGHIWALSQLSLFTHNPAHSFDNYSLFLSNFFPGSPLNFFCTQVIWQSPGILLPSPPYGFEDRSKIRYTLCWLNSMIFHQGLRDIIDLNFLLFNQGPRDMIDLISVFHQGPQDTKNHKITVSPIIIGEMEMWRCPDYLFTGGKRGGII